MRRPIILLLIMFSLALIPAGALALTVTGSLQQGGNPIADIAVNLERQDGTTALTVRTGNTGEFRFTGVSEGVYRLTVRLPQGQVAGRMSESNYLLPSVDENARTDWLSITQDTRIPLVSSRTTAGFLIAAFVDSNENGGHMSTEPDLAGATVEVYADGHLDAGPIASAVSSRKGEIALPGMSPGTYRMKAVFPSGYMVGPIGAKQNAYYNWFRLNDSGEAWTDPITVDKGTLKMGLGAVTAGSAEGSVWLDANMNGVRDPEETGFSGAKVTAVSESQGFEKEASWREDGTFVFDPLQPGTYALKVTLPQGYMFAAPGSDSLLTEGYSATASAPVSIVKETVTQIRPIGVIPASGVRVQFYLDENANGRMDDHEPPFRGSFTVSADGQTVLTVQADETGLADAPVVRNGRILLTASAKDGGSSSLIFSVPGKQNDFSTGSASDSAAYDLELKAAEQAALYAAVTYPASVSGLIYLDKDGNGVREPMEDPLSGFQVEAVDESGNVTAQTVTDESGRFVFERLIPRRHTIRFRLTDPYIASPAQDGSQSCIVRQSGDFGETELLSLAPGQAVTGLTAALFKAGTVQGNILVRDAETGTSGLDGVLVTLIREDGTAYSDYTQCASDGDGFYYLKGILPGAYCLKYELPDHALFEDSDSLTRYSAYFTIENGSEAVMPELYAVRTAQLAGTVTLDGEPVAASVTAFNEQTGFLLVSETEPETGAFDLKLLRPGAYTVTVTLPQELVFGAETALVPCLAQSASTVRMELGMGERLTDLLVTAAHPSTVCGVIYDDEDHSDAWETGENVRPGFALQLLNTDGELIETLTADENGFFSSGALVPDRYLISAELESDCILVGGYQLSASQWALEVTVDSGVTTEQNVGILRFAALGGQLWSLDGSLAHVSGIPVLLYDAAEPVLPVAQTETDENGYYAFPRLYPGSYQIGASLPAGYAFARSSDTAVRSSMIVDGDGDGLSDPVSLRMGEKKLNADIGFGAKGSIGDFAWLDENHNGMQDIGEKGVPGIILELYQGGQLIARTETDVYGHYLFRDIYPGKYTLRVTMHAELTATLHQTEFPLINSILPDERGLTVETQVVVPSGSTSLSNDIGFVPVTEGVYPAVMDTIPAIDWSDGGRKNH